MNNWTNSWHRIEFLVLVVFSLQMANRPNPNFKEFSVQEGKNPGNLRDKILYAKAKVRLHLLLNLKMKKWKTIEV